MPSPRRLVASTAMALLGTGGYSLGVWFASGHGPSTESLVLALSSLWVLAHTLFPHLGERSW